MTWLSMQTSQSPVEQLCRVPWRTVGAIIARVVAERDGRSAGLGELLRIGIDEKSHWRGHRKVKGPRWIVRPGIENMAGSRQDGLSELAALDTHLHKLYTGKEQLRRACCQGGDDGRAQVTDWIEWARESGLCHMPTVARRLAEHVEGIDGALRRRVSSARTQCSNTRLHMINRRAQGLHSTEDLIAPATPDLGRLCLLVRCTS